MTGPADSDGIVIDFEELEASVTKYVLDGYDRANLSRMRRLSAEL